MACGVKPGDMVVTVPHTFIATTEAISQAGALPEFVDIDEQTYNMSVEQAAAVIWKSSARADDVGKLISRRSGRPVTAVVPVHLYGQMADMDPILRLAERYGLIGDRGCMPGPRRRILLQEAQPLDEGRIHGPCGGVQLLSRQEPGSMRRRRGGHHQRRALAAKIRMLRDHGQAKKYYHDMEGYNGRLDAIQAGLLHAKLPHLAKWNSQRRERAAEYNRLLESNEAVILPYEPSWSRAVYHLYVIRTNDREGMMNHLKKAGIGTGIHYPIPLHLQKAYASLNYGQGDFPVAERVAAEIISLPMFPQLSARQQSRVADEVLAFASTALQAAGQ